MRCYMKLQEYKEKHWEEMNNTKITSIFEVDDDRVAILISPVIYDFIVSLSKEKGLNPIDVVKKIFIYGLVAVQDMPVQENQV